MNSNKIISLIKTTVFFSGFLVMVQTATASANFKLSGNWQLSDASPLCQGNFSSVTEHSVLTIYSDAKGLDIKLYETNNATSWRVPDYAAIVRDVIKKGFSHLRLTGAYSNGNRKFTRLLFEPPTAALPSDGLVYEIDALDRLLIYRPIGTPKFREICFFERIQ